MQANLRLEQCETRDCPSSIVDQSVYNTLRIPGWSGTVREADGDFLGRSTSTRHDVQHAFVAGEGGSIHVVIRADSPPGTPRVQVGFANGVPVLGDPHGDEIKFSHVFFNPGTDRMGGSVAAIHDPATGRDKLTVTGLRGAGAVVILFDVVTGDESRVLIGDPSYRGGIEMTATTIHMEIPAGPSVSGNSVLIITPSPGGGGGPLLTAVDVTGHVITSFLIGPIGDRSGEYQPAAAELDVDVSGFGHRGLGIRGPDGVHLYDWRGSLFTLTY